VTITCRGDVQLALSEALAGAERRTGGWPLGIPPVRVTLTAVEDRALVPPIPADEIADLHARRAAAEQQQAALLAAAAAEQQAAAAAAAAPQTATAVPSGDVIEIDDWLLNMIEYVKESSGLDPDK
jgi:hypothetical protein